MDTKALKKQMGAAIAMVLVAAVALGSATFAWFVTNNKVTATTSTISAQSNAAFMKIKYNATAADSDLTADVANIDAATALYPAQWANDFTAEGILKGQDGAGVFNFETAYGTNPTENGFAKSGDWMLVGTPVEAAKKSYAVANVFNISSKGTNLTNLKVSGASIETARQSGNTTTNDSGNTNLDNALRVLVCTVSGTGDNETVSNWVLCDKSGVISDSKGRTKDDSSEDLGKFGDGVSVEADKDTKIVMYVYYDGNDSKIYSNNLSSLKDASSRITVSFTADAQNK